MIGRTGRRWGTITAIAALAALAESMLGGQGRTPATQTPIFLEQAAATGLIFTHLNGATGRHYLPEVMGAGVALFDYDNDGWPDLFIANGAVNIVEALRGQRLPYRMKNQLFRNTGAGRFEETSTAAGASLSRAAIGRGAAFGDIDNDGDIDIVVTNNAGPVGLLINQVGGRQHGLQVLVRQPSGNLFGFGAWIGVERAGRPTLWRRVRTDGSYLSASDVRVHFGLGSSSIVDAVVVQWPDGVRERWRDIAGDTVATVRRGTGSTR